MIKYGLLNTKRILDVNQASLLGYDHNLLVVGVAFRGITTNKIAETDF